jgi:hypothetical protein
VSVRRACGALTQLVTDAGLTLVSIWIAVFWR